ncbi:Hypothetical protein R9X50_00278200 [Acrodontium crateriforme]|uniref:Uncharacterized protein n=1 Tax=Acrodontium crateriforme TaxID=150365 RepID=A0AAQ3M365_9PEZI|nr:Hypothetical protein R9X50_00278200 [Acrodontium crateriforme]
MDVDASCAICGAPPYPECPHEGQRLELALTQAMDRWAGLASLRKWVLDHARNTVIGTFQQLKRIRYETHVAQLQSLPYYTVYMHYPNNPPIPPQQLATLHLQIQHAQAAYKQGVDEDWRRSCLRYPEVLDYFFGLVEVSYPNERDASMTDPRFGGPMREVRRVKPRGESGSRERGKERKKAEKHHSRRGRTPPLPPMPPPAPRYR